MSAAKEVTATFDAEPVQPPPSGGGSSSGGGGGSTPPPSPPVETQKPTLTPKQKALAKCKKLKGKAKAKCMKKANSMARRSTAGAAAEPQAISGLGRCRSREHRADRGTWVPGADHATGDGGRALLLDPRLRRRRDGERRQRWRRLREGGRKGSRTSSPAALSKGSWSAPIRVDWDQPFAASQPRIAAGPKGELLVVWVTAGGDRARQDP